MTPRPLQRAASTGTGARPCAPPLRCIARTALHGVGLSALCGVALLAGSDPAVAAGAPGGSRVARVVVYPDRAQVTRVLQAPCGPKAVAEFRELPPAADLRSLRAQAGDARVEGIDLQESSRADAFAPKAAELEARLRTLEAEQQRLRDAGARARAQARAAEGYASVAAQQISREMAVPAPDLKQWGAALEQAQATRLRASAEELRSEVQLRALERQVAEARRGRDAFAEAAGRTEKLARVLFSCPAGATAEVELSYLVGGASWSPAYEARALEEAGGAGSVDLSLYATVEQRTGEQWSAAHLVLSTAIPRQDATPPELLPLRLHADAREPPRKILVRRDEEQRHAEAGAAAAGELEAAGGIAAQGLSVQFSAREPADVPGDGAPVRLKLAQVKLKAAFSYQTAPGQLPFVLRVADLTNGAPFPLLEGPVDLFRKGGLAGHADLERVAEGARFHLAFGLEEQLRVKRLVLEEVARDTGVFAKGRRFRYAYAFELHSFLPGPATVVLRDHLPVSELDDVEVAVDDKTTPGYDLQKDDGIASWMVKLAPGETRRIDLAFHVEVPAAYDSGGL